MLFQIYQLAQIAQLCAQLAPVPVHASLARAQQYFPKDIASVHALQAPQTSIKRVSPASVAARHAQLLPTALPATLALSPTPTEHAQLQSATVRQDTTSTLSKIVRNAFLLARPAAEEDHLTAFLALLDISWSTEFVHKAAAVTLSIATLRALANFAQL